MAFVQIAAFVDQVVRVIRVKRKRAFIMPCSMLAMILPRTRRRIMNLSFIVASVHMPLMAVAYWQQPSQNRPHS